MKNGENTSKERIQVLLDKITIMNIKAEADEKGLGKSSLIRTLLKERYNRIKDDRNEK